MGGQGLPEQGADRPRPGASVQGMRPGAPGGDWLCPAGVRPREGLGPDGRNGVQSEVSPVPVSREDGTDPLERP